MTVELSLYLFGKPAWELDGFEGNDLPESFSLRLAALGDELKARLHEASEIFVKLVANGWQPYGTLYDITFSKSEVETEEQAKQELEKLGINPESVNIIELEEEEEWE